MIKPVKLMIKDAQGSVLVVALVILALLTLIGISATTTSDIEIQIAGNEMEYVNEFYIADSAWREGVEWLNTKAAVPVLINKIAFSSGDTEAAGYYNIRNYGNMGADYPDLGENEGIPLNSPDGRLGEENTKYWYQVAYKDDASLEGEVVAGSGKAYRRYNFRVNSVASEDTKREIEVTASKVYRTGY